MTVMRRPSPIGELLSLREAMDRLFEDSFVRPRTGVTGTGREPALDVWEEQESLVIQASLPGVKPEDVDITITGSTLTITGDYRSEQTQEKPYVLQEIRRGTYTRSVTLPQGLLADKAAATFENGILTLRVPKAEEVKPRQIKITPATQEADAPGGQA